MSVPTFSVPLKNLIKQGLQVVENIHYQSSSAELVEHTLRLGEGALSDTGALVIKTGQFTGRSPKDKFIVREEVTEKAINWNEFNNPIGAPYFDVIYKKMLDYVNTLSEFWIRDCYASADPKYRLNFRLVSEKPWSDLFAYNMFLHPQESELDQFKPEWQIFAAPGLQLNPAECGTRQSNATVISFTHKIILIAGTGYTGEIKKGVFYVLNYLLPQKNVLPMHSGANVGRQGDTALFLGLSGTGKTTLSADPERQLIGDDEHGWSDEAVFDFEGGCYAKTIRLSREEEPLLFDAIRPGALVENAVFYLGTNQINFDDAFISENARVSYPLHFISHALEPAIGDVPKNIFFLTCDAFGVIPPLSKLTPAQAIYQFLSGYTARLAGTEVGVTDPKPVFSACFGAPFLPLHPSRYADLLQRKLEQTDIQVWLVNTGWTGGPFGKGHRIKLVHTRAMITAVLNKELEEVAFDMDPVFGLAIPAECPGVSSEILNPRNTWAQREAYDAAANELAKLFIKNFEQYAPFVTEEVRKAGPEFEL